MRNYPLTVEDNRFASDVEAPYLPEVSPITGIDCNAREHRCKRGGKDISQGPIFGLGGGGLSVRSMTTVERMAKGLSDQRDIPDPMADLEAWVSDRIEA